MSSSRGSGRKTSAATAAAGTPSVEVSDAITSRRAAAGTTRHRSQAAAPRRSAPAEPTGGRGGAHSAAAAAARARAPRGGASTVTLSAEAREARDRYVEHLHKVRALRQRSSQALESVTEKVRQQRPQVEALMRRSGVQAMPVSIPEVDEHGKPTGEEDTFYVRYFQRTSNPVFTAKSVSTVLQAEDEEEASRRRVSDLMAAASSVLQTHEQRMAAAAEKQKRQGQVEQRKRQAAQRKREREQEQEAARAARESAKRERQRATTMERRNVDMLLSRLSSGPG